LIRRAPELYSGGMTIDDPRVTQNLAELARILAETGDAGLIERFFRNILTPAETADIAGRWALVKALNKKVPQREIAKNLGISLCKITRGSRELKKPGSAFQPMLAAAEAGEARPVRQPRSVRPSGAGTPRPKR
jgi:TrpR family trp operon transcriptional repressor